MIDTDEPCVQPVKTIKRFIDIPKDQSKSENNSSSKTTICILLAIFIGLVFIAVVYKKK
jgi:hypothetical protein